VRVCIHVYIPFALADTSTAVLLNDVYKAAVLVGLVEGDDVFVNTEMLQVGDLRHATCAKANRQSESRNVDRIASSRSSRRRSLLVSFARAFNLILSTDLQAYFCGGVT
jgi:hypothetical protein